MMEIYKVIAKGTIIRKTPECSWSECECIVCDKQSWIIHEQLKDLAAQIKSQSPTQHPYIHLPLSILLLAIFLFHSFPLSSSPSLLSV